MKISNGGGFDIWWNFIFLDTMYGIWVLKSLNFAQKQLEMHLHLIGKRRGLLNAEKALKIAFFLSL